MKKQGVCVCWLLGGGGGDKKPNIMPLDAMAPEVQPLSS